MEVSLFTSIPWKQHGAARVPFREKKDRLPRFGLWSLVFVAADLIDFS